MELNYNSAVSVKSFLEENGLGMRKRFGQNFLLNPSARQTLVDALDAAPGESVWEIGPGLGAMTRLLLDRKLIVHAFEIDPGFIKALKTLFANEAGFHLIEGDVLETWRNQPPPPYLLGNLPYNIASVLLADFIEQGCFFRRIVVTVQREVALRMAAKPGTQDYSSFSVLCASAYHVKPLVPIKSASFYPRPKVDSQGVLLELREDAGVWPPCFYRLVRQLFSSRRKTIKNNLTAMLASQTLAVDALARCGLAGSGRAENMSFDSFTVLAKTMEDMGIL